MKFKRIINVKKLISVLLCSIIISSNLPLSSLNGIVFAESGNYSETSPLAEYKNNQDYKENALVRNYNIQHVSTFDELQNAINNAQKGETILFVHGLGSSHLKIKKFINEFKSEYRCPSYIFIRFLQFVLSRLE